MNRTRRPSIAIASPHTPTASMKTMNRIVLAAGAVLALAACGADAPEAAHRELEPVAVTVTASWTASSRAAHPARVVPLQEAEVATRMAGSVSRMAVRVGDRVAQGALLASLDAADVNARIAAARAQEELARRTFTRVENLHRDGAASLQELDQARAQLAAAESMTREAEAQAAYVEIRAPFAGTVTARMADEGDLAAPGHPLVQLSGNGVKVVAELPAELVGSVRAGDRVRLEVGTRVVEGTVRNVAAALSRASRRFPVEVTPEAGAELLPGAFVRLTLPGGGSETRWIPTDAVVRRGQLTGVYALEADTLRLRYLRLGRERDGAVEILAGPPGELQVVRAPASGLEDGHPVQGVTRAERPASSAAATTEG